MSKIPREPHGPSPVGAPWRACLLAAFATAVAGEAGYAISVGDGRFAALWLPSGVALTALLFSPPRQWPWLLLSMFGANLVSDVALQGRATSVALGFAAASAVEALTGGWLLRRWCGGQFDPCRPAHAIDLAIAGTAAAGLGGLSRVATVALAFDRPFTMSWPLWWTSSLIGVLLIVPLAASARHALAAGSWRDVRWPSVLETALVATALAVVAEAVFGSRLPGIQLFPGVVWAVFLWACLRCGFVVVSALLFLLSILVMQRTAQELGPFALFSHSPEQRVVTLQLFLGLGSTCFLMLASLMSERARTQMALRQSEERLQLALTASNLALWDWDVPARMVYVNDTWGEMIGSGRSSRHVPFEALVELVHPDDRPLVQAHLKAVLKGERQRYDVEHRVRTASGAFAWIHSKGRVIARDAHGRAIRLAGTNNPIDDRKVAEQELYHRATRDAVTGLANRSAFLDRLDQAVNRARRSRSGIAVLFIDLDHFKHVNDRLGHAAGDEVLEQFGTRISALVRRTDLLARLGGDEFALLLESAPGQGVVEIVAEAILARLHAPFDIEGHQLHVTASIGGAWSNPDAVVSPSVLISQADAAMYEAKRQGRNRYRIAA